MTYQGVTVLYDMVRWEEKSLAEASKKIGAEVRMQDCRESRFDLDGDYPEFGTVLQRCVSYYRNVHSTAALEGAGCMVINPLKTGIYAGNKLYSHMLLREYNVPTPKADVAFSKSAAIETMEERGYPVVSKPTVGSWGRMVAKIRDSESADAILWILHSTWNAVILQPGYRKITDVALDAHVHNDIGFALANAFAACEAGVSQIHTTIDGIGERTGIPALAEVAVGLTYLFKSANDFRLDMLQDLSRLIEDYTGIAPYDSKPIVGSSAYKHKAGTHLAAILKNPAAYEPIPPRTVGNRRRIVFGELAGKTGAAYLMAMMGLKEDADAAKRMALGLKDLRMGDLIDMPLDERVQKKIIGDKNGSDGGE